MISVLKDWLPMVI